VKRFGGNPDKFSFNDFEEFSALDYIDFISSFDLIVSKKIEAPPEGRIQTSSDRNKI